MCLKSCFSVIFVTFSQFVFNLDPDDIDFVEERSAKSVVNDY